MPLLPLCTAESLQAATSKVAAAIITMRWRHVDFLWVDTLLFMISRLFVTKSGDSLVVYRLALKGLTSIGLSNNTGPEFRRIS